MIHVTALALAFVLAAAASPGAASGECGWTLSGRLQIRDGAFVDGRGIRCCHCAHFGEAFSAWIRHPAAVETQLQEIGRAGYDCIRFWDNLGEYSEAWRGKEVSPFSWTTAEGVRVTATPDYYGKLEQFLTRLKHIGLAAHHSRGDLGRKTNTVPLDRVVAHSQLIAQIYDRVGWDVLALYEGNNEDFQNGNFGPAGLLRIVEPIKSRGALVASSCPAACSEDPSDVVKYHEVFRCGITTASAKGRQQNGSSDGSRVATTVQAERRRLAGTASRLDPTTTRARRHDRQHGGCRRTGATPCHDARGWKIGGHLYVAARGFRRSDSPTGWLWRHSAVRALLRTSLPT